MGWIVLKDTENQPVSSGNLAIHAALVPTKTGPVIFYFDGVFGEAGARVFDVNTLTVSEKLGVPGPHIFCSGHAFLDSSCEGECIARSLSGPSCMIREVMNVTG